MQKIINIAKINKEHNGMKLKLLYSRKLNVVINNVSDVTNPIIIHVIDLTMLFLQPS